MKANQVKDVARIKPNVEGNVVYLASLPEYVEGEKGNSYNIVFKSTDGKEELTVLGFDPFNTKPDTKQTMIDAGYNKIFRFYRAFMDDNTYEKFADIDHQSLKELIQIGNKMMAPDSLQIEATILCGFSLFTGYLGLPSFEHYISTKYAARDLTYPMSDIHPIMDFTPKKAPATQAAASSKPDQEDDDEV